MTNDKTLIIISLIICVCCLLMLGGIHYYIPSDKPNDTVIARDTIWKLDTVEFIKNNPIPKEVYITKVDTVFSDKGDSIFLKTENKIYNDTICQGKDTIFQTNYISGINATLDSSKVILLKHSQTITNTIEITKYVEKRKILHFSPQVGVGYGAFNKNMDLFIGFGVSIDLY